MLLKFKKDWLCCVFVFFHYFLEFDCNGINFSGHGVAIFKYFFPLFHFIKDSKNSLEI